MANRMRCCWVGLSLLLAASALAAGCTSSGQFSILGYTTEPNYDPCVRTVYVPIAKNITYRRGLEFDVTRAVIREIEWKTPMKVVSCRDQADTELDLKVVTRRKTVIIPDQLNLVREAEVNLGVEVVWRDLRPGKVGEILSNPKSTLPKEAPLPGMPVPEPLKEAPVLLLPVGTYIPELGGSTTTAEQEAINRLAVQIVSMMEKGW